MSADTPQFSSAARPVRRSRGKHKMITILVTISRRELYVFLALVVLVIVGVWTYRSLFASTDIEIVDPLAGNIFPSEIISTAASGETLIKPVDTLYVGNPNSLIGIRLRSRRRNTRVRVEVEQTPFFSRSVSEFVLPRAATLYTVYPDIVWNYQALRANVQATPLSVVISVSVNGQNKQEAVRTFSVRSINECLLGYFQYDASGHKRSFVNTRQLFAGYVNEDNPKIDKVLREALSARTVNRFMGYQADSAGVERQVYALWNVLQRRGFKYSSISQSSLSSNVVYSQRVRTFDDALASVQINCVDGSVLFASLLRAIDIDPILVRLPGHMFVGYYTDRHHRHAQYLEMTMIGDVNLDDYFPDQQLDSTMQHLTQSQVSRMTFDKSKEYAWQNMASHTRQLKAQSVGYMYLPVTDNVRRRIQPIGR